MVENPFFFGLWIGAGIYTAKFLINFPIVWEDRRYARIVFEQNKAFFDKQIKLCADMASHLERKEK